MNTKELTQALETLGWLSYVDDVGDRYAQFKMADRIVQIVYGIRDMKDSQQLEVIRSLSTTPFSKACLEICGNGQTYTPLIRAMKGVRVREAVILEEHVCRVSEETIIWAEEQDLLAGLRACAALSTDAPGARPIWHLAALVLSGDADKLKYYQASFEAGDRLGFVTYITKDYIDRAVSLLGRL
ncbi:MAG: hypothetical protein OQL20_08070 [Sedimenticola sp.]|nr:hypothetical protein [Sedimenticola sp.]